MLQGVVDNAIWGSVAGIVLPPVLAIVEQTKWRKPVKAMVAFAACIPVAAAVCAVTGQWRGLDVPAALTMTMVATWASYTAWWKPSEIAPTIEKATNFVK